MVTVRRSACSLGIRRRRTDLREGADGALSTSLFVQAIGSVSNPSTDVLTHGGEHDAQEPAVAASRASLAEMEVIFLALDRSFSARAGILVKIPEETWRFDSKLDRTTNTFIILGFWLEDETLGRDDAFAKALARGFARFVTFLGASELDAQAIHEPLLRQRVGS
jgi:hypothetical protein